ncbi:MAG: SDR family oxidoreductase [Candidatus Binatia bacterium]
MSVFRPDIIKDQVVLVTGGATGIGKEIGRTLGAHGARLAIASRKLVNLEAARAAFEGEGIECLCVPCDVRNPDEVENVIGAIIERYGRLDIVVNNAAGNFPAPMSSISYNGFKAVIAIDLLGTYNVSKAAFEAYLKDHGGNIVNISAPFAHCGASFQAHVAAAKTGIDSLTRTCAVEWGPLGIRVNAVAPGAIAGTEGMARFASLAGDQPTCPLRRYGTGGDIANAVLFLVSEAASYITGVCLVVDGAGTIDLMKIPLV